MEFIVSSILGGILYDLIKDGTQLTIRNVFGNFNLNDSEDKVCKDFISEVNQINGTNDKKDFCKKILSEENRYTKLFENNLYKTNFAKRLDYIIFLMNDAGYYMEKYNIEKLGERLGFKSVNDLKKYYLYSEEPDYVFIEKVAKKLGVNVEWMKNGEGEPYKSILPDLYRANEILRETIFSDIEEFIFVMDDAKYRRNLGVILKLNGLKYNYYPYTFVFHADVGGGGSAELLSVYLFLKELNNQRKMPSGVYKIAKEEFDKFFSGKVYPGSIKKYSMKENGYLLDDFISLYNSEEKKESYCKYYGKVFVDCQTLIKNMDEYY